MSGVFDFLDTLGNTYAQVATAKSNVDIAKVNAESAARVADQASAAPAATLSAGVNLGGTTLLWIVGGLVLIGGIILIARR